ncbi:hypothetical protein EVAR_25613_1 [Eumeta japonica]|uniref:Uncharacterized protein n=1 Tax=Eumeta variegata TaxID=151549 RepID=A0A4C1V0R2_EUMVA|nr:hypothetical protein EVAR_25613_1 [Eumeta japonica]
MNNATNADAGLGWRLEHSTLHFEMFPRPRWRRGHTCACVNSTLLFRRCASGNCMGLASGPAQAASPPMLLTWPMPPDVDVISLETEAAAHITASNRLL